MLMLASIQRVSEIAPLEGTDHLSVARVLGWTVVVRKDELAHNSRVIFVEADAVVPEMEAWSFLRESGWRVRTRKIRGQLSEGLAVPLPLPFSSLPDGTDLTAILGITKYEPPQRMIAGEEEGSWPVGVPKTDEVRLQAHPGLLKEIQGRELAVTLKLDGTSATFFKSAQGEFFVCSRNRSVKRGENTYWNIAQKYDLEKNMPRGTVLQGEICGPGIQQNPLGLSKHEFFVFDLRLQCPGGEYLEAPYADMASGLGLSSVPPVCIIPNGSGDLRFWLNLATTARYALAGGSVPGEGIVVRPVKQGVKAACLRNRRMSFKVINPDYLLNGGEQ